MHHREREHSGRRRHILFAAAAAAATAAAVSVPAARVEAASVTVDPLAFEVQHRSNNNNYLASRAQVTATGLRNGFQSNFGTREGVTPPPFPNGGIGSVYYFKLPSLAPGETIASSSLWFSSLRESSGTAVEPTFNIDFYAMGFESNEAPHAAPIDATSGDIQNDYAQTLFYIGPEQTGTWTNSGATPATTPIVKIQDNLLRGEHWIPNSDPAGTNEPRQISAAAELALGSYIQSNLYGNPLFVADHDLLTLRMNPDVTSYSGAVNQRYQISTNQTDTTAYPGLITPVLNLVIASQWNQDNSTSNWSTAGSWLGTVPNATDRAANFGGVITAPQTVNVDSPQTVAMMTFDNANAYTLAGSTVTLQGIAAPAGLVSNAAVFVSAGSHTISAPLVLASPTVLSVTPAGSTLAIGGLTADGQPVTKSGAGSVSLGSSFNSSSLNVSGGTLQLASNGSASRVINTGALSISGGGKLDLQDNKLITTTPAGTATGGVYDGVQGMVQSARNGGAWNGATGITTSLPTNNGLTSIGVATGAQIANLGPTQTATFAGQTITADSTIAMYTYGGDANLDGIVSGDDYTAIDFNILVPGADGWVNGDFNYDGIISGDDYTVIDFNILAQGAPFPNGGSAEGVTAVPEPASLSVLGLAATALLGRRRRTS